MRAALSPIMKRLSCSAVFTTILGTARDYSKRRGISISPFGPSPLLRDFQRNLFSIYYKTSGTFAARVKLIQVPDLESHKLAQLSRDGPKGERGTESTLTISRSLLHWELRGWFSEDLAVIT